ncbi:MAG: hypothetical protein ACKVJG_21245 [Candidatus Latescibacterota bacterium]|jgi:hypothetical protein
MKTDRTTKTLLTLIVFLLSAHLLKDLAQPAYAKSDVQRVMIVGIDHRIGAKWDELSVEVKDEKE